MKSPLTKALAQETLNRSHLQVQRATIRHGLPGPLPPRTILGDYPADPETPVPTPDPSPTGEQPTTTTTPAGTPVVVPAIVNRVRNRVPGWAKAALGVAIGGPMVAAAVALGHYMSKDDETIVQPAPTVVTQPPAPQVIPPAGVQGGDLLDWLEKESYNR